MTKQCAICEKRYNLSQVLVKLRGKYNPTSKRKQKPNLQWMRLPSGNRILACTKCIKAQGKKNKN